MQIHQQPCDYIENEIDEEEESFEDLLSVCGISEIKSKSRYPRSMGFSLKNFIKNEIRKRKMKLGISLPYSKSSKIRSLTDLANVKLGSRRKSKLLFGQ